MVYHWCNCGLTVLCFGAARSQRCEPARGGIRQRPTFAGLNTTENRGTCTFRCPAMWHITHPASIQWLCIKDTRQVSTSKQTTTTTYLHVQGQGCNRSQSTHLYLDELVRYYDKYIVGVWNSDRFTRITPLIHVHTQTYTCTFSSNWKNIFYLYFIKYKYIHRLIHITLYFVT